MTALTTYYARLLAATLTTTVIVLATVALHI